MPIDPTDALSPLDGRYRSKLEPLRRLFSEGGLMRARVRVECAWLLALAETAATAQFEEFPSAAQQWLQAASKDAKAADIGAIKAIEARTNHDVKAVEYYLRGKLHSLGATAAQLEWVHFGCTSEDINNLAYALMLDDARREVLLPAIDALIVTIHGLAQRYACVAMLARTHGQAATPTTVGKEFANFAHRLRAQRERLSDVKALGKMNGAVGNFNAHVAALPDIDWTRLAAGVIHGLGLTVNAYTTQIEPHDWIAEYAHALERINTILIDLARDLWSYISIGYFKQRLVANEVGSSTMPHKVNPIDFENAEGNLGVANALLAHFAAKLPISRWQRDLTDSTVLRNLGVALGHGTLAYQSLAKGLSNIDLDAKRVAEDLDRSWEVLGEAVQTVMRAHGIENGYDRLKEYTRGQAIDRVALHGFIESLDLPRISKDRLLTLTPAGYLGLAERLARNET